MPLCFAPGLTPGVPRAVRLVRAAPDLLRPAPPAPARPTRPPSPPARRNSSTLPAQAQLLIVGLLCFQATLPFVVVSASEWRVYAGRRAWQPQLHGMRCLQPPLGRRVAASPTGRPHHIPHPTSSLAVNNWASGISFAVSGTVHQLLCPAPTPPLAVNNWALGISFAVFVTVIFWGLNEVARELEDPFCFGEQGQSGAMVSP